MTLFRDDNILEKPPGCLEKASPASPRPYHISIIHNFHRSHFYPHHYLPLDISQIICYITIMDDLDYIIGLMRDNSEAVGFIPSTTVTTQYINKYRYVIQYDERGHKVGYILHGSIRYNQPLHISQHCIDYDKRLKGYGEAAFNIVRERARVGGASIIKIRVAEDLPAVSFWQSLGFRCASLTFPDNKRRRAIIHMEYPVWSFF